MEPGPDFGSTLENGTWHDWKTGTSRTFKSVQLNFQNGSLETPNRSRTAQVRVFCGTSKSSTPRTLKVAASVPVGGETNCCVR